MSLFDELKDRIRTIRTGHDMDNMDDYYDDEAEATRRENSSGVLGNTRRPEAESVNVFTRSGRPLSQAPRTDYYNGQRMRTPQETYGGNTSAYAGQDRYYPADQTTQIPQTHAYAQTAHSVLGNTTGGKTPGDLGLRSIPRPQTSGQLPPYILKPASYDDVQMVVRRVRTNQPVVLVFKNTNIETAKRILDFCLGLTCGISGRVDEVSDRVFVVLPQGVEISKDEILKLISQSTMAR